MTQTSEFMSERDHILLVDKEKSVAIAKVSSYNAPIMDLFLKNIQLFA